MIFKLPNSCKTAIQLAASREQIRLRHLQC